MFRVKPYRFYLISYAIFLVAGFILWWQTEHGFMIHWWADNRSEFWTLLFYLFDMLGEEWGYLFFGLLVCVRHPYRVITLGLGGVIISGIVQVLKFWWAQPRPTIYFGEGIHNINVVEGWHIVSGMNSLPSGHTAGAFTLVTILCFYNKDKPLVQIILLLFGVIAGMARIYGVNHFLIDILVGSFLGVLVGFISTLICEKYLPERMKSFRWKNV